MRNFKDFSRCVTLMSQTCPWLAQVVAEVMEGCDRT